MGESTVQIFHFRANIGGTNDWELSSALNLGKKLDYNKHQVGREEQALTASKIERQKEKEKRKKARREKRKDRQRDRQK